MEKFLIRKRKNVNVQVEQDGMVLDVLLCKFVKMDDNGMSLNLCVNVQHQVIGTEMCV